MRAACLNLGSFKVLTGLVAIPEHVLRVVTSMSHFLWTVMLQIDLCIKIQISGTAQGIKQNTSGDS